MSLNNRILFPTQIERAKKPAAGELYTFTIPPGKIAQIASVKFQLTAANAGLAREIVVYFDRARSVFSCIYPAAAQPVNTTWFYSYQIGFGALHDLNAKQLQSYSLPIDINLQPDDRVGILVGGLNATDQLDQIVIAYNVADFISE